jgi:hypothetical protein
MPTSPRPARLRPVALPSLLPLAALCAAAACGGGDDPVGPAAVLPVAASRLDAVAEKLEPVMAQPVLDAFLVMRFGRGLPFDGQVFFPLRSASVVSSETRIAPQLVPRIPSIPDTLRGRTLVRDSMTFDWKIDRLADGTPRPGAPAGGLRFVLSNYYTPGPSSTTRVGTMDLTQQGTGTAARFTVDVRDLQGMQVLHYSAPLAGTAGTGWVSREATRIDQTGSNTRGAGMRWTSASIPLEAERAESFGGSALSIVHVLPIDGVRLRLVSTMTFTDLETSRTTYTVFAGEAPFARRVDQVLTEGTWQHVGEGRPLTEDEQAQVRAFLRVLIAIPDAEAAWQEAVSDLIELQFPMPTF